MGVVDIMARKPAVAATRTPKVVRRIRPVLRRAVRSGGVREWKRTSSDGA
jgi:hypothetical protein